jgi:hypothetical protein
MPEFAKLYLYIRRDFCHNILKSAVQYMGNTIHQQDESMIVDQDYSILFCAVPALLIGIAFLYVKYK